MRDTSKKRIMLMGDSILDNAHWVPRTVDTVTWQLKARFLKNDLIINLAMDGFTTSDFLSGAPKNKAVTDEKHTDTIFYPIQELADLTEFKQPSHIVLSVGGNDLRESLKSLIYSDPEDRIKKLSELFFCFQENLKQIIKKLKKVAPDSNIIIVMPYTPGIKKDLYFIYYLMYQFISHKVIRKNCLTYIDLFLYQLFGRSVGAEDAAVQELQDLMEFAYEPIISYARKNRIPLIDLATSFDYANPDLYVSQIEPSGFGSIIIAELISHVIKNHDFNGSSAIYSKPGCSSGPIVAIDSNQSWKPHNIPMTHQDALVFFHAEHKRQLKRDQSRWCGIYGLFAKTRVSESFTIEQLIYHAHHGGKRTLKVMHRMGWSL